MVRVELRTKAGLWPLAVAEVKGELPRVGAGGHQVDEIGHPKDLNPVASTTNPTKGPAQWQTVVGADLDDRVLGQADETDVIGWQERTHGLAHLLGKGSEIGA